MLLSLCTIFAQFPLIYEVPTENLIKYSLAAFYILLQMTMFKAIFALPFRKTMPTINQMFLAVFSGLEVYKMFIHKVVLSDKADFLPLMATSVFCSIGIHLVFLTFLYELFGRSVWTLVARRLCLWKEAKIRRTFNIPGKPIEPKLVAGLDISTLNKFDYSLSVVSCTVCAYPEMNLSCFVVVSSRLF